MRHLFLLLLLVPIGAFGQKNEDKVDKYVVDIFFSPDFYKPAESYPQLKYLPAQSYCVGANIVWHLQEKPNFAIRSGFRYAVYNQKKEYTNWDSFPVSVLTTLNKIDFIEIPLAFRYYFFSKKLRGYGEIMTNYNTGNKDFYLKVHFTWGLSLGLEYALDTQFAVFLQPTFRRPFEKNDIYTFSKGIEMGLKYQLSKHQ